MEISSGDSYPTSANIPNETTARAIEDAQNGIGLTSSASLEELIKSINEEGDSSGAEESNNSESGTNSLEHES